MSINVVFMLAPLFGIIFLLVKNLYLKNNKVNFSEEIIKSMGHRTTYDVFK